MTRQRQMLRWTLMLLMLLISTGWSLGNEEVQDANEVGHSVAQPLSISVLWFANDAGPEDEHWAGGIRFLLVESLDKVSALRVREGIRYARITSGFEKGDMLEPDHACHIGEVIEAQRVIWGRYGRVGNQWQVTLFWLNVSTGESSDPLVATSSDWFEIRNQLVEPLLDQLGVTPLPEEQQKMVYQGTESIEAVEWYLLAGQEDAFVQAEAYLQEALAVDPNYAEAWVALAGQQCNQGDFEQGWDTLQRALKLHPDLAVVHSCAASILLQQKKYALAEQELKKVQRLDPRDARSYYSLGQVYAQQKQWSQAISHGRMAVERAPWDSSYQANLGMFYAFQGDREQALVHLKEAERLTDYEDLVDFNTEMALFKGFVTLKEYPEALEHGECFVELAKERGWKQQWIEAYERMVTSIRTQLTPVEIETVIPQVYTHESLHQALRQRLTPEEMDLVVYPLAGNAAVEQWAHELIAEVPETHIETDLARALFAGVMQRKGARGGEMDLTAAQVFAVWDDPEASFDCEAFAKLYIALARAVGLQAFYVHIDRDCRGKLIDHDCAIVFIDDKAVFVDPAYNWFGPGHQEFLVLDDLQTVAHHLCQHGAEDNKIERCRVAIKLHPDYAWIQLHLANALWNDGERVKARAVLDEAERLEPGRWNTLLVRSVNSIQEQQWELAQSWLDQALEANPDSFYGHYLQGMLHQGDGNFDQARDSFRRCLQCTPPPHITQAARQYIIELNEHDGMTPFKKVLDRVRLKSKVRAGH